MDQKSDRVDLAPWPQGLPTPPSVTLGVGRMAPTVVQFSPDAHGPVILEAIALAALWRQYAVLAWFFYGFGAPPKVRSQAAASRAIYDLAAMIHADALKHPVTYRRPSSRDLRSSNLLSQPQKPTKPLDLPERQELYRGLIAQGFARAPNPDTETQKDPDA